MSNRLKKNFPYQIKLRSLFEELPDNYQYIPLKSAKLKKVYGTDLILSALKPDRPIVLSSFVESIDGKITYKDSDGGGPLIANSNLKDKNGALADFWIMNMLRAVSDAVVIGSSMLTECLDSVAHVYDLELEEDRIKNGKPSLPMNILPTLSGKSIDYNSEIFHQTDLSLLIISTKIGVQYVKQNLKCAYTEIRADMIDTLEYFIDNTIGKVLVVGLGDKLINNQLFFKLLKKMKINVISVETSYYFHNLLADKLVDEIFLNYSGIYLGGNHPSIANNITGFSPLNHPHCRMISLKMHSAYFIYTRQKFEYD